MTLMDLKERAFRWFYTDDQRRFVSLECSLTGCYLSTTSEAKIVSLAELGLTGTRDDPLNIFVVPRKFLSIGSDVKGALEKLFDNIWKDPGLSNKLSEALLRATHFPPACCEEQFQCPVVS